MANWCVRVLAGTVAALLVGCAPLTSNQATTATPAGVGATAAARVAAVQPTSLPPPPMASPVPNATAPSVATTAPTDAVPEPPTAVLPPTATLVPPQANSFPTGQTEPYATGLSAFQTIAFDPTVGQNDGDGIELVTFEVVLRGEDTVYSKREENAPFCAFGDDASCDSYDFAAHGNTWPGGVPIAHGAYTLVVLTQADSGATKREELSFAIQLAPLVPTATLVPPLANSFPQNATFTTDMFLQSIATDPNVGPNDGDGIETVTFLIADPTGRTVHKRSERKSAYCAFGGGDDGAGCPLYVFAEHGNAWLDGTPIEEGLYTARVTVRTVSGAELVEEMTFTIDLP